MPRGPHTRRDEKTKGNNVIKGFRMEPDLARRLTDYARKHFVDAEDDRADLARTARWLLRTALSISPAEDTGKHPVKTRGLMMDSMLFTAIERERKSAGLSLVGAIRHVLRIALGVEPSESLSRERRFAMIAEVRRGESA